MAPVESQQLGQRQEAVGELGLGPNVVIAALAFEQRKRTITADFLHGRYHADRKVTFDVAVSGLGSADSVAEAVVFGVAGIAVGVAWCNTVEEFVDDLNVTFSYGYEFHNVLLSF
jgi:hypothetical protein